MQGVGSDDDDATRSAWHATLKQTLQRAVEWHAPLPEQPGPITIVLISINALADRTGGRLYQATTKSNWGRVFPYR